MDKCLVFILLFHSLVFASSEAQATNFHCVRNQVEFEDNWNEDKRGTLIWAASEEDLPQIFQGTNITGENIFYYNLSSTGTSITHWINDPHFEQSCLYLKYYSHGSNGNYVGPVPGGTSYYLPYSAGFIWKEDLVELETASLPFIDITVTEKAGAFMLFDELRFVQGLECLDIRLVKRLECPTEANPSPTPTAPPKTSSTTRTSPTAPTTSSPPPSLHFHCVRTKDEFHLNEWRDPTKSLRWVRNSRSSLSPFFHTLELTGSDIFYFDLSSSPPRAYIGHFFLQPLVYPRFIYLKYYAHGPPNQKFVVLPASNEFTFEFELESALDFEWREAFIELHSNFDYVEVRSDARVGANIFFDTVIVMQGEEFSNLTISQVRNLCPE